MQEVIRCGAMGIMYVIAVATNVQIMPAIRKKDILFAGLNLGICTICMSSMFRWINANSFELMVIAILVGVGGCIYLWAEKRISRYKQRQSAIKFIDDHTTSELSTTIDELSDVMHNPGLFQDYASKYPEVINDTTRNAYNILEKWDLKISNTYGCWVTPSARILDAHILLPLQYNKFDHEEIDIVKLELLRDRNKKLFSVLEKYKIYSNEICYIFSNAELEKVCSELRLLDDFASKNPVN